MPELLLHYIWLQKAFMLYPQQTTDGREVEVIDVGIHNSDSGPDFFNAKIKIDGVLWVGNVEIHIVSSDWYRHKHQDDAAYDNVILHVVKKADKKVYNSRGEAIPQCELQYPKQPEYLEKLLVDRLSLCNQRLSENPELLTDGWRRCLLNERMVQKRTAIGQLLEMTHNHWEEAFYVTLAHNFGFHTNGLPFELVARQTPLSYLNKHRDSLFQLEAILFGQSGLLTEQTVADDYSKRLLREYEFLRKKFSLNAIEGSMWKMLRMRPQNFPHIRLAQFAALLNCSEFLFSKIIQSTDLQELRELFSVGASEYWRSHYRFGGQTAEGERLLGKNAIDLLLINTVVPYKYAYGIARGDKQLEHDSVELLRQIPAEKNHIIEQWKLLGMKIRTAADSQLFLQLYQRYCIEHRCYQCDVGYQIFTIQK